MRRKERCHEKLKADFKKNIKILVTKQNLVKEASCNFAFMHKKFTKLLLQWHKNENKREMPWKGEKDPYKVWLSEIILQQTRVEQGGLIMKDL